jgi:hypothetical protein
VIVLAASAVIVLWLSYLADGGRRNASPPSAAGTVFFVVICLAAGGIARMWGFDRSLWRDEFGTLWAIEQGLAASISRVVEFHGQSPFYYVFVWSLVHAVGESEIVMRLP